MTDEKLPDWYLRKLSKAGKKGGKRSLKTMTPAERTARAKTAAAASAKVRAKTAAAASAKVRAKKAKRKPKGE